MTEIAALPLTGVRVASLFSGCGGSSLGYRMAGCKVVWANEFIPAARDTYTANFPGTPVDPRDVREISGADILAATGLEVGDLDILDGSPPCASFSTAGKRSEDWGKVKAYSDTKQRTDDLFLEYARILGELQPRRFIAENVSGLVKGVGKGWFLDILAALKAAGYRVRARLLDAQWLGVPQARQRLFFVGVRGDLDGDPGFPSPLAYRYSVRDALPWIDGVETNKHYDRSLVSSDRPSPAITIGHPPQVVGLEHANGFNGHAVQSIDKPAATIQANRRVRVRQSGLGSAGARGRQVNLAKLLPTIVAGDKRGPAPRRFEIETESDMSRYATGAELAKLGPGEQSDKYFQLVRAPLNGPSPTVTAEGGNPSIASVAHPVDRRKFSIAELRRICGFPDDFVLTGTYAQQWERLGRAVPPPMMAALVAANLGGLRQGGSRMSGSPASPIAGNGSTLPSGQPSRPSGGHKKRAGKKPAQETLRV